jgi:hypothetical protein
MRIYDLSYMEASSTSPLPQGRVKQTSHDLSLHRMPFH